MLDPLQEVTLAPQQELVQGRLWVAVDVKVVFVGPDLQAHQHDSNVESPIQLQAEEEAIRRPSLWEVFKTSTSSFTLSMWFMAPKIRALVSLPCRLYWRKSTNVSFRAWLEFLKKCSSVTFPYLRIVHNHVKLYKLLHACAGFGFLTGNRILIFKSINTKKARKLNFPFMFRTLLIYSFIDRFFSETGRNKCN